MSQILANIFPAEDAIPEAFRLAQPINQREYLVGGELKTWAGSLNPVLSCGSIMKTPQAELLGFPNPLLGIVGFSVVVTTGVAVLGGATLPRWYWLGLQAGSGLGVVFVHWLIYQSLYVIGALCPYCLVVWAVTIAVFWYTTLRNLGNGSRTAIGYHSVVLVLWYSAIGAAVLQRFWDYWKTVL